MKVEINEADDSDEMSDDLDELLNVLLEAYGDSLPEHINSVEEHGDLYRLEMGTVDVGRVYGQTLAANGWAIISIHQHYTDGEGIDRLAVKRFEDCTISTLPDQEQKESVEFDIVQE